MLIMRLWENQENILTLNLRSSGTTQNFDPTQLTLNSYIDVKDREDVWLEGQIKKIEPNRILIHYLGWETKWDEWINKNESRRYASLHTFSQPKEIPINKIQQESKYNQQSSSELLQVQPENTMDYFVGNKVKILRNNGKWTEAEIVEIDPTGQFYSVKWCDQKQTFSKLVSKNELCPSSQNLPVDTSQIIDSPPQTLDDDNFLRKRNVSKFEGEHEISSET